MLASRPVAPSARKRFRHAFSAKIERIETRVLVGHRRDHQQDCIAIGVVEQCVRDAGRGRKRDNVAGPQGIEVAVDPEVRSASEDEYHLFTRSMCVGRRRSPSWRKHLMFDAQVFQVRRKGGDEPQDLAGALDTRIFVWNFGNIGDKIRAQHHLSHAGRGPSCSLF